jgi:hypothetical protein
MNIVEETRTRLHIKHLPLRHWFSGWPIVIGSLCFLIYCIFFESASASLTCKRTPSNEINCELRRYNLLGSMKKQKIFDPQEAYVKTHTGSRGGKTYQIIILTPFGDYRLLSHLSYQNNHEVAAKINNFIINGETYLLVHQNQRQYVFFFSLIMLVAMGIGAFLATTPVSHCTFYKSLNKVLIERKGWRSHEIIEYPLESILRFDIQDKQFKYSKLYRAVIVLQLYKEIPINPEYTELKSVEYALSRIRYFLNIN